MMVCLFRRVTLKIFARSYWFQLDKTIGRKSCIFSKKHRNHWEDIFLVLRVQFFKHSLYKNARVMKKGNFWIKTKLWHRWHDRLDYFSGFNCRKIKKKCNRSKMSYVKLLWDKWDDQKWVKYDSRLSVEIKIRWLWVGAFFSVPLEFWDYQ